MVKTKKYQFIIESMGFTFQCFLFVVIVDMIMLVIKSYKYSKKPINTNYISYNK